MPVFAGLASILGHNFSPFLRFKGGKGVATSLGVAFGMSPIAGAIGLGIWVVLLLVTRYISLASIIAVPTCCVFIWWFNHKQFPYIPFGVLASAFSIIRHMSNMKRLKNGTEPKVVFPWNKKTDDDGSSGDSHITAATG
jgi:glycerol-3-phosphate acyltransferase PlsY